MDLETSGLPEQLLGLMRTIKSDLTNVEVKSAKGGFPKDVLRTISAFANTSGGVLILGVSEQDGFLPVENFDAPAMRDALGNACRQRLTPPVTPRIEVVPYQGTPVVVADIPEMRPTEKPCYITASHMYEGSYVRVGDGDRHLTPYEIDRLREERAQPKHDLDVVDEATLGDLDSVLIGKLLARERSLNPLVFGSLDDSAALRALRVIRTDSNGEDRPTLAGLLALGVFPQTFFPRLGITFVEFPGTRHSPFSSGRRYVDSQEIGGSIPTMVAQALSVIERNTRTGALVSGAFRQDLPDYPPAALREAIANALMHRDYSPEARGGQVQINLYADCLEITNPGGLFGGVTVDTLGMPGVSSTRNQFLSKLLSSTPYPSDLHGARYVVENKGTGYVEIKRTLADALMRDPLVYDSPGRFTIVFERRRLATAERQGFSAAELDEAIIQMIMDRGTVSTREIQDASGLARSTVLSHLKRLINDGAVEPTDPAGSKRRRYRLV